MRCAVRREILNRSATSSSVTPIRLAATKVASSISCWAFSKDMELCLRGDSYCHGNPLRWIFTVGLRMRVEGHEVLLSASDLMVFMSCRHATGLDLRYARGEPLVPADDTEDAKILQKQGEDHESRYLSMLKGEGRSVIAFVRVAGLEAV